MNTKHAVLSPRRSYSAREDALILAAAYGEIATLAVQLGRTAAALQNRRRYLVHGPVTHAVHRLSPRSPRAAGRASVFAQRPAYFEEDTETLARRGR